MKPDFDVKKADSLWVRFAGFMLKKGASHAIFFENCRSVHTFFMRFTIDIVFLDKKNKILAVREKVKPWRVVLPVKNTQSILEIPSNIPHSNIYTGNELEF